MGMNGILGVKGFWHALPDPASRGVTGEVWLNEATNHRRLGAARGYCMTSMLLTSNSDLISKRDGSSTNSNSCAEEKKKLQPYATTNRCCVLGELLLCRVFPARSSLSD